ncbi:MAG: peptidase M38 [Planctomycetota bacterium]|nr:MAG: peptidase M38 [Planctomycetota bacterium]
MIVLSNVGKLYDGSAADASALHTGVDLLIEAGRVKAVQPHDPTLAASEAHTVVDCSAYTVTPGLIDCHAHVTVLGLAKPDMDEMLGQAQLLWVERILYAMLVNGGVTTARDIGGATHLMKRLVDEGMLLGPRLKIAIAMLSTTGGHADFRGIDRCHGELSRLWPESAGRPSSIVDGPWECRKRVREIAACGADLIKICASPGVASPGDALEHRDFSPEEIQAITDEAGARGLEVAAHAHSASGIELAIKHGVKDIQHISFMDERLVEMAHAKDCIVTPTSWIMHELPKAGGLSDFVMGKVKQVMEVHAEAVRFAHQGGLPILAGTDAVLPGMHGRNWAEIGALVTEGLGKLDAWYSATGLAAKHIHQTDAGTLLPGQRADLLVCQHDVLEDPDAFERDALLEVFKDGEAYRGGLPGVPRRRWSSDLEARLERR